MQCTVTNTSGHTINTPDLLTEGAIGGAKTDPLPYPFGHVGPILDTANKQVKMRIEGVRGVKGGRLV